MKDFDNLSAQIKNLDLNEEQRTAITAIIKRIKREQVGQDFKIQRILKDKTIVSNVLNATISELEQQKKLVENQSEQLKIRLKELKRSYTEMEQFSYIASHDLKSPLRTISNFAQILQRKYKDNISQEANEYLDFVVSGAKQMNTVICDLLEYSKVGHGQKALEPVKIIDVIDLVKFNLRSIIKENDATIKLVNSPPTLMVKRSSIIQLFQNLIENAIKFRSEEKPEINIHCKKIKEDCWEFKVIDNGVGIEQCYQKKAFLPFQRLNEQERPGSGIGLAICKKAVDIHGGQITFESTRGEGTAFCFTLCG